MADRFTAIERALPAAAVIETILTKGRSPGTTSLGQLDRVDRLRAQDQAFQRQTSLDEQNAVDRALQRQKTEAEIKRLNEPDALSDSALKRQSDEELRKEAGRMLEAGEVKTLGEAFSKLRPLQAGKIQFSSENRGQSDIQALADILKGERDKVTVREEAKNTVEQQRLKSSVKGFRHTNPELTIEKPEVDAFKKALFARDKLNPKLDQIIKIVEEEGNQIFGGNAEQLRGRLKGIQLDIKGPEFAALGVLAGPDVDILNDVTGDPTSISNAIFSFGGVNPALEKLKRLKGTVNRNSFIQGQRLDFVPVFKSGKDALAAGLTGNFFVGDEFIEAD